MDLDVHDDERDDLQSMLGTGRSQMHDAGHRQLIRVNGLLRRLQHYGHNTCERFPMDLCGIPV